MITRRHTLLRLGAGTLSLVTATGVVAAQRQSLTDPLRLAADDALVDSGFAPALQTAFGRDTGVAVKLVRGPATSLLEALERGEHDAALTNAPDVEAALDKQGLVHDRRRVAASQFVLIGPATLAKALSAGTDAALALSRLAQAQAAFLSRGDGSGTHLAELAGWRAAKTAPAGAWYQKARADEPLVAQARDAKACTLVERGVWAAAAGSAKGLAVLADADARLAVDIHVMRTFRAERQHPAGKLFVSWISGDKGRAVVATQRGYQTAGG
ncbi:MAG TPA: substrate-binding domain-containing protein [Albitalea sp.]|jgi:tungstate transport system substrate-binding protein|nr:substrate-binding domain-containing protein [Albitalea sp.]